MDILLGTLEVQAAMEPITRAASEPPSSQQATPPESQGGDPGPCLDLALYLAVSITCVLTVRAVVVGVYVRAPDCLETLICWYSEFIQRVVGWSGCFFFRRLVEKFAAVFRVLNEHAMICW